MSIKKSGLGIIMAGAAAAATTIIATVCVQRNAKKASLARETEEKDAENGFNQTETQDNTVPGTGMMVPVQNSCMYTVENADSVRTSSTHTESLKTESMQAPWKFHKPTKTYDWHNDFCIVAENEHEASDGETD